MVLIENYMIMKEFHLFTRAYSFGLGS